MKLLLLLFCLLSYASSILDRQYYKALRVPVSATADQIREAYRKLSRKYHPDRNPDSKSKFEKINSVAYETLYNEEKKYLYDRLGKQKMNDPNIQQEKNLHSLKGSNIQVKLVVTLQDLYLGKQLSATIFKNTACPHCQGTGAQNSYDIVRCSECQGQGKKTKRVNVGGGYYNMVSETCPRCKGEGKIIGRKCSTCSGQKIVSGFEDFNVVLEPGTFHSEIIRFINMGDEIMEGAPGDLILRVHQARHSRFTRRGNDLHTTIHLSLKEALFGFERDVEQLDGRKLSILREKISQPNEIIRLEGEGMPVKGSKQKGDMIVSIAVSIPPYTQHSLQKLRNVFDQIE